MFLIRTTIITFFMCLIAIVSSSDGADPLSLPEPKVPPQPRFPAMVITSAGGQLGGSVGECLSQRSITA